MPRQSEPFTLIKRPPSPYWHFKLQGWTSYKTTGEKTKTAAMKVVQEALQHQNFNSEKPVNLTFREYAQPYFIWETCPRVQRKLYEGSTIGKTHVQKSRMWLEKYVFTDKQFCKLRMFEIRRHHVLDFRKRLINKIGLCNTVNKVRDTIRTIFSEAFLREEIPRNPAIRIGNVKYNTIKRCVFSTDEIKLMFRECPGAWGDLLTYTVFYTAAFTGMRRNEILALMWDKTLLRDSVFLIHRAWKGRTGELGPPKWNIEREIPVSQSIVSLIYKLRGIRINFKLVFCYEDGQKLGETWWRKNFFEALYKLGMVKKIKSKETYGKPTRQGWKRKRINYIYINKKDGKVVSPHSLRHSLNSNLLRAGCNETKIQSYMGWKPGKLTKTQQGYTEFRAEDLRDVVRMIDEIYLIHPTESNNVAAF